MMGGRRLVRLRLTGEKRGDPDKAAAEALKTGHAGRRLQPGRPSSWSRPASFAAAIQPCCKAAEKTEGAACGVIPCYEDEPGDVARLVTREALTAKDKVSLKSQDALDLFVARLPRERGRGAPAKSSGWRCFWALAPAATAHPVDDLGDFLRRRAGKRRLQTAAEDAFGGKHGRGACRSEAAPRRRRARAVSPPSARWVCILEH